MSSLCYYFSGGSSTCPDIANLTYVDDHHNHDGHEDDDVRHDYHDNDHNDDNDGISHLLKGLCAVRKDCESFEASALAPPEHQHRHWNHHCGDDNGDDDDNGTDDGNDDGDVQDDDGGDDARPELRSTWQKCQRQ